MMEVTFDITNMSMWLNDIASKYLTTVIIKDCIPWKGSSGQAIVCISNVQGKEVIEDLHRSPGVETVDVEIFDGTLRGTVGISECHIIRWILDAGCFLEQAKAEGDGKVQFKVLAGKDGSIPELMNRLKSAGFLIDIKRLTSYSEDPITTKRQRDAVRMALDRGYFDYPCKVSVKDLAKECGVSESTMRETLRRAQRNILMEYFSTRKD